METYLLNFAFIPARAQINFTLTLDVTRSVPLSRAYIGDKERAHSQSMEVNLGMENCVVVHFNVKVSYIEKIEYFNFR